MSSFLQQTLLLSLLLQVLCISSSFAFTTQRNSRPFRQFLISSSKTSVSASTAPTPTTTSNMKSQYFDFQGHQCYSEVASPKNTQTPLFGGNKKPEVLLLHGFGCSTVYWRETCRYLNQAGYTVHAVDLLGQGKSDKPGRAEGIEYSTSLWAQVVDTYAKENMKSDKIVVVGNSLGSCVALAAATGDFSSASTESSYIAPRTVGIGMYNCGVGMNSRNVIRDPVFNAFQRTLLTILFDTLDFVIFGNKALIKYLLTDVVTKELLQNALTGLYACASDPAARVDDALVESFYRPAKDSGSVEALNQIYTNDPGKTPMEFHEDNPTLSELPIKLIWGDSDAVTPIAGSVGQFYTNLAKEEKTNVSLNMISAGHIPFDEIPECNEYLVRWLDEISENKSGDSSRKDKPLFAWPFAQLS